MVPAAPRLRYGSVCVVRVNIIPGSVGFIPHLSLSAPNSVPLNKVDLPPLAILKNVQMFVSQITWWVPHVFVWRSPKRSKMSSSAYNVPHTKYMWTSTWPGLAGFGVLSADSVHARPPYSTCRPGHLPRGSVPPGVPDEAVLLSPAPGGSPYILYGSPNEPPFFGPPPEPQIRQDLYGLHFAKIFDFGARCPYKIHGGTGGHPQPPRDAGMSL